MTPNMLNAILEVFKKQRARVVSAALQLLNEPLLNPHISQLIAVCHRHRVPVVLSSNLTRPALLGEVLAEEPENFIISVSGFEQSTYERSHKGGVVADVRANMLKVAQWRQPGTFVRVSWHRYDYNAGEESAMREFTRRCGFKFTPFEVSVLSLERALARFEDGQVDPAERHLLTPLEEAQQLCLARRHWPCMTLDRMLTVHSDGMLQPCCPKNYQTDMKESIFTTDLEDYNWRRRTNPECLKCQALGGHVYAMMSYREPLHSPMRWAGHVWRRSGLGGWFPGVSRLAAQWSYPRPRQRK